MGTKTASSSRRNRAVSKVSVSNPGVSPNSWVGKRPLAPTCVGGSALECHHAPWLASRRSEHIRPAVARMASGFSRGAFDRRFAFCSWASRRVALSNKAKRDEGHRCSAWTALSSSTRLSGFCKNARPPKFPACMSAASPSGPARLARICVTSLSFRGSSLATTMPAPAAARSNAWRSVSSQSSARQVSHQPGAPRSTSRVARISALSAGWARSDRYSSRPSR